LQPIYGFASGGPFRFRKAIGHRDLFYTDDREVDFKDVIEAPLPKAPLDTEIVCHWLAIEGVQPAIPENAPLEGLSLNLMPWARVVKSLYEFFNMKQILVCTMTFQRCINLFLQLPRVKW
jgi:hypothetical protein